jgi:hypothetical protein
MTSANAKVIPAEASDVTSADATDVISAEAADVATTKATDVTSAEAAHVTATKATTVSATTTAAGLCTGGNKAAGKQRTCQYHYQSSSHDISPLGWADNPPQDLHQMSAGLSRTNANVAMDWRWEFSSAVSIKISFNIRRPRTKSSAPDHRSGVKRREVRTRSLPRNRDRSLS